MIRRLLAGVAVAAFATSVQAQTTSEARVLEILKTTPLIDGHNDLPWALRQQYGNDVYAVDLTTNLEATTRLHTDIARLRAGGVGGQFWSVYVPASLTPLEAVEETFEQIDTAKRIIAAHPDVYEGVRGEGLMLGLKCKAPNTDVVAAGYDAHLLVVPAADNVVRLLPPLNITDEEMAEAVARLDAAALAVEAKLKEATG